MFNNILKQHKIEIKHTLFENQSNPSNHPRIDSISILFHVVLCRPFLRKRHEILQKTENLSIQLKKSKTLKYNVKMKNEKLKSRNDKKNQKIIIPFRIIEIK